MQITDLNIKISQENKTFTEQHLAFVKREAIMAHRLEGHGWYLPNHSFFQKSGKKQGPPVSLGDHQLLHQALPPKMVMYS